MTVSMATVEIRCATASDIPDLFRMVQALAAFEKLSDDVRTTPETLAEALFSESPKAVAYLASVDGKNMAYALLVPQPYIKRNQSKLLMEDFFVDSACRGQGVGKRLMQAIVEFAKTNDYFKLEWRVANWNQDALEFYDSVGGTPVPDWTSYSITL